MKEVLPLLPWPAMLTTLVAAWLVAAQTKRKRSWGFWWFVVSNVLWVIWGLYDNAYALITLQMGLFALNLRGAWKNEAPSPSQEEMSSPGRSTEQRPDRAAGTRE